MDKLGIDSAAVTDTTASLLEHTVSPVINTHTLHCSRNYQSLVEAPNSLSQSQEPAKSLTQRNLLHVRSPISPFFVPYLIR
jgi:hypothetical protein